MDRDKHLQDIMNDIIDSHNGGDGSVLEEDRVVNMPRGEKISRLSEENIPAHERGLRVLDL